MDLDLDLSENSLVVVIVNDIWGGFLGSCLEIDKSTEGGCCGCLVASKVNFHLGKATWALARTSSRP
jgi:hypothetical protein